MDGLLQNARRFFQGLAPAVPLAAQRFSVTCPDGHRLSGVRTEGYQALRCPICGEGIFVLPRSPLPDPGSPAPRATKAPHASTDRLAPVDEDPVTLTDPVMDEGAEDEVDGTIEWVDGDEGDVEIAEIPKGDPFEAAQAEMARAASKPRPRAKPAPAGDSQGRRRAPETVPLPVRAPFDPISWARARRNPLIFAAVAIVVAGTVSFRIWRQRIAELPIIAERGRLEGLKALDEGRFETAYQLLSEARRAVLRLGDDVQGASAIKQGADEAEIIAKLVSDPLEQLLEEARRTEPDAWDAQFSRLYKGHTIIVEAQVTAVPDGRGEGRYELNYRILPDGEGQKPRTFGKLDLNGFKHFEQTKPRLNDIVIFGAALASFKFDTGGELWLISLEPDSGVIMTHHGALEALGWEPLESRAPAGDP